MPNCIEWGEERNRECTREEDRGYDECAREEDRGYDECCDWAPCSWFCDAWVWISNVVCVAWTWVSNVVCVAWTWITTTFCILWDVVTTVVNLILVTLESILGWVLSALAFIIELLEMIPILGTLIRWILNGISYLIGFLSSIGDLILGALGIRPEKILRICTVILRDETGTPTADVSDVVGMLQLAVDVYKRDANIRIVPLGPFNYSTGFAGADTVDESWVITDANNSDLEMLEPEDSFANEWWTAGSKFQWKVSTLCFYGAWRRVSGYGAPITIFIVHDTQPNSLGRSLGITDYVFVDGMATDPANSNFSLRTAGHEVGHSCMLLHTCVDDGIDNLMATATQCDPDSSTNPDRLNPVMDNGQVLVVRSSKHVTFF
jgi:hypothetical protein